MLERQHLYILKAIDENGTVTGAAGTLHLTQSALSHAVKKLESNFGITIWQKEGRRVRLTQSGKLILAFANRVIPQFEHTERQLVNIADGEKGMLRIGMECHPCYRWLLNVVKPYIKHYPQIDMDVKQQFQFGALGALLEYDIDLIITPDPLHHPHISYQSVFDYEHVLVVSNDSPLAKRAFIEPLDLVNETLITYPVEKSRLDIFSRFLTPAGAGVRKHKIIEATEIMLQLVAAHRGVAALPRWLVEELDDELNIQAVSLGEAKMMKSIYLGVRNNEPTPDYITGFRNIAQEVTL